MVIMEGKELYSCSLSSIVINPFAVQWSQDNHLSIITEKGIHIFVSFKVSIILFK